MDLDISMRSSDCPFTVHFYGAMFREGDVWICMEVENTDPLPTFQAPVPVALPVPTSASVPDLNILISR